MTDAVPPGLRDARAEFAALVADVRPELHRYCARMTGSVMDGEDLVQDVLMRAFYALSELDAVPPLRPWLFRIAKNRALDELKSWERRMRAPTDEPLDALAADGDPEDALARAEAERAAVSRFVDLPPAQRGAVILKDVLGSSLEEIAELLDTTVPAVKALLHRGRARLRRTTGAPSSRPATPSPELERYAKLFGARAWDELRATLGDDVRLDLVGVHRREGREVVGNYYGNYAKVPPVRVVPADVDGVAALAVFRDAESASPGYFVRVVFDDEGHVAEIRDYRYVPYVARDAKVTLLG